MDANDPSRPQGSQRGEIIEKELSREIVAAFFEVYNALGFGFLERHQQRQSLNYVTAFGLRLGILLHFGPHPAFHRVLGVRRLK
jgi:hypothetical protein